MNAPTDETRPEHLDVIVVGAGLSGIGAACHLRANCPGKSLAVLESRQASGGTWDLFRYPGIRSDSDMFTLGYSFRPWEDADAIADGPSILEYIRETARDHGIEDRIRFHHRVVSAEWSTADGRWSVAVERTDSGEIEHLTCDFLFSCTGYYRYDEGYTPEFAGRERFGGRIVHPQHWPDDLDLTGKRVVVIGSGATAVTLIPSLTVSAAHVTMLQRSPGYMLSLPSRDRIADRLRRLLPARAAYGIVRWKNIAVTTLAYQLSRRRPELAKRLIRRGLEAELPAGYDFDTHFKPRYEPWDQRLCLVPDGDLFRAIRDGDASIVTDRVAEFTADGIRLESGGELPADVVITATGLNLLPLGGLTLTVDGDEVELSRRVGYKGIMLSGVPNLAIAIGYSNASWTLKCDLAAFFVCRLLNHMDRHGYRQCTPRWPERDLPEEPFLDLTSGYVQRSIDRFPKQGPRTPWRLHQNYARDLVLLRYRPVADEGIEFTAASATRSAT
jgi:cation diffusion facilitator CzcD-associated flavoprotein CzcO